MPVNGHLGSKFGNIKSQVLYIKMGMKHPILLRRVSWSVPDGKRYPHTGSRSID